MAITPGNIGIAPTIAVTSRNDVPTVTISIEAPSISGAGNVLSVLGNTSATFCRPPSAPVGFGAALGGATTTSGTPQFPAIGGSVATGTPAAATTLTPTFVAVTSKGVPPQVTQKAVSNAANAYTGYMVRVQSSFAKNAAESTAVATLYSATGTPPWAGRVVAANGYFRITPDELSDGDVVQVKVTLASGASTLSNGITFSVKSTIEVAANVRGQLSETNISAGTAVTSTHLYFVMANAAGVTKLFRLSFASGITEQVTNLASAGQTVFDSPTILGVFNDNCYFSAVNSTSGIKLHRVGASGTVFQLSNTRSNLGLDDGITAISARPMGVATAPTIGVVYDNTLYFRALNNSSGNKLFRINTSDAITQVSNTRNSQTLNDDATNFVVFNNNLYGALNNINGVPKLMRVQTNNSIVELSNTSGSASTSDGITILGQSPTHIYFRAVNVSVGRLFRMNTSESIELVSNNYEVSAGAGAGTYWSATDSFYFRGISQSTLGFPKLYRYDQTNNRIVQLSNLANAVTDYGADGVSNNLMKVLSNGIYFIAFGGSYMSNKLFRVDASDNVTQVGAFNANFAENTSTDVFEIAGKIYAICLGPGGLKLWQIVDDQVYQLSDFGASADVTIPIFPSVINGSLYFTGSLFGTMLKLLKFTP